MTNIDIMSAALAAERLDMETFRRASNGTHDGKTFAGVPRAPLNMTRGVDFDVGKEWSQITNFISPAAYKLKQLRDFFGFEVYDSTTGLTIKSPNMHARETPIGLRLAHVLLQMSWNCVARYHPTALEFHTLAAPPERTDSGEHSEENMLACIAAAWWGANSGASTKENGFRSFAFIFLYRFSSRRTSVMISSFVHLDLCHYPNVARCR